MNLLSLDELRALPEPKDFDAGVYFLWRGDELVYIGQSKNVPERHYRQLNVNKYYKFHMSDKAKYVPHDRITVLVMEKGPILPPGLRPRMRALEMEYLNCYQPPFNGLEATMPRSALDGASEQQKVAAPIPCPHEFDGPDDRCVLCGALPAVEGDG